MGVRGNRPLQQRDANGHLIPHQDNDDQYVSRYRSSTIRYHGYARPGVTADEARWRVFEETIGDGPFDTGSTISVQFANGSNDYDQYWDTSSAFTISAVSDANPAQVTTSTAHGYSNGDIVEITGTGTADLDKHFFTVTVVDSTKFTIGTDRTGLATPSTGSVYERTFSNFSFS